LQHPGARRFFSWPGLGGAPAEAQVNCFADLVSRVTREIAAPVALLAQSMGGVIAVLAALEKPSLVRHLVLSVTSGGLDMASFGAVDWRAEFSLRNPGTPTWFLQERTDLSARLAEVKAPVLLLWGDADPISPVAVGRRLAELLPSAELVVVEGGTHDLVHERADEVAPFIERHLRRSPAGEVVFRTACLADAPAIEALIAESARALGAGDYSAEQIEGALRGAWGVDTELIRDGTYFVGESQGELVLCGGWSRRATSFGGDAYERRESRLLDARTEAARIRAFFVHPRWARRGLSSRLLALCETEARRAGFVAAELVATLPGERLYARHGYVPSGRQSYALPGGRSIEFVPMSKLL
jgi:GNAT superfamily N-acetyltransferase